MGNDGQSVLVMDDEGIIREIAASMLRHLGYEVMTCANGEEASRCYRDALESGRPYLGVIMDLVIFGGMGGIEAAKEILQIDPEANLVVSSGYSDEPVMADPTRYGFRTSMQKPYTLSQLQEVMTDLGSLGRKKKQGGALA